MSGRQKSYAVRASWAPDYTRWRVKAYSEEEAIEIFKEEWEQEILRNWIKYTAEEEEMDEE